jgi:hypothetical protein
MQQPIKVLLPWLERDEAVTSLLGRVPNQDEDVAQYVETWEQSRTALNGRPVFAPLDVVEATPVELEQQMAELRGRADIQQLRAELSCDVGIANLEGVISFQKTVASEEAEVRVARVTQDDWNSLVEVCLPQASLSEIPILFDQPNKAFTVSSLNPNLRINGIGFQNGLFQFQIQVANSIVQVAEYRGRWFLRDGYHRCYGLLRKNITRIPCLIVRAQNFQQVGAAGDIFFSYELLFGDRPPMLRDFLNDTYSRNTQRRATRKVIRIVGQEFVVDV